MDADDIRPGDRVRMSEELKQLFRGKCGVAGTHLGPVDVEDPTDCWGCSTAHVEEFGESVGTVAGFTDYNNCKPGDPAWDPSKVGPEVDVYWEPSRIRFCYLPSQLEKV